MFGLGKVSSIAQYSKKRGCAMITLEEIKKDINGIQVTLARLETRVDSNAETLDKIEKRIERLAESNLAIVETQNQFKGMITATRWIAGAVLLVLTACGGIAGAVVSKLLS